MVSIFHNDYGAGLVLRDQDGYIRTYDNHEIIHQLSFKQDAILGLGIVFRNVVFGEQKVKDLVSDGGFVYEEDKIIDEGYNLEDGIYEDILHQICTLNENGVISTERIIEILERD